MVAPHDPHNASPDDDVRDATDAAHIEAAMRWRLILGRFADESLDYPQLAREVEPLDADARDDLGARLAEAERLEVPLDYLYDRAFAERAHRPTGGAAGSEGLTVPAWLADVREVFPREAVQVIEADALHRFGLHEIVTDASVLARAERNEALVRAILQFKHRMAPEVLDAARQAVREVVDALADTLRRECEPALHGAVARGGRPPVRTARNADWRTTVRRNLAHWDADRARLVVERVYFRHRQRRRSPWRIIVAVDQSGSMADSLIHGAVMAAIFASLPHLSVNLVLWDTRVVDLSHLADDPLEALMASQLGGGTELIPALRHCASLVDEPARTLLVVVSDWYVSDDRAKGLRLAHELREAGVTCIGLNALDAECRPVYDEGFARELANRGWFVASLTPKRLAEHVAKVIA